jgi:bacterioferritin
VGAVLAPVLAAIGALIALLKDCTIEVERAENQQSDDDLEVEVRRNNRLYGTYRFAERIAGARRGILPARFNSLQRSTTGGVMRGNEQVIAKLNEALREELTAINQYFVHAEMCHNWGYHRLGNYIRKQSIGEMKHAEELLERIIFLDGAPKMEPLPLTIGPEVRVQLQNDLDLELKAVVMYNDAIKTAREAGDNTSRELFEQLLKDEEQHVDFLEAQLHQIKQLGYERYLSQQIEGSEQK